MDVNQQQNNSPLTGMPVMPPVSTPPQSNVSNMTTPVHENKSSIGSIIGTIIVIAIIILGGLYFWGKRIDEGKAKADLVSGDTAEATVQQPDENMEANTIMSVTSSDDVNSIDADLKATNLDNLGTELDVVAQ